MALAPELRDGVADDAAKQGQHHALGEQLAYQAAAARADRKPGGDFPLPCRSARQQQVGDVRAGSAQHQGGHPSSIRKNTTIILRKPGLTWPARST